MMVPSELLRRVVCVIVRDKLRRCSRRGLLLLREWQKICFDGRSTTVDNRSSNIGRDNLHISITKSISRDKRQEMIEVSTYADSANCS